MTWIAVIATGGVSLFFRVSMLVPRRQRHISPSVTRVLGVIAPAVIAAMLAAELAGSGDDHGFDGTYLFASLAALVVARSTGHMMAGAYVGMALLWAAALVGA